MSVKMLCLRLATGTGEDSDDGPVHDADVSEELLVLVLATVLLAVVQGRG